MKTAVPDKGKLLTQISLFWFDMFKSICPNHIITTSIDEMPEKVSACSCEYACSPFKLVLDSSAKADDPNHAVESPRVA